MLLSRRDKFKLISSASVTVANVGLVSHKSLGSPVCATGVLSRHELRSSRHSVLYPSDAAGVSLRDFAQAPNLSA